MRKSEAAALLLATSLVSAITLADSGKDKVAAVCQTCHGMDGIGTIAGVPNLSGQKLDYLIIQLEAYRSGQRQHPQMSIIAQSLSDDDIERTSRWYADIEVSVTPPE